LEQFGTGISVTFLIKLAERDLYSRLISLFLQKRQKVVIPIAGAETDGNINIYQL